MQGAQNPVLFVEAVENGFLLVKSDAAGRAARLVASSERAAIEIMKKWLEEARA